MKVVLVYAAIVLGFYLLPLMVVQHFMERQAWPQAAINATATVAVGAVLVWLLYHVLPAWFRRQ